MSAAEFHPGEVRQAAEILAHGELREIVLYDTRRTAGKMLVAYADLLDAHAASAEAPAQGVLTVMDEAASWLPFDGDDRAIRERFDGARATVTACINALQQALPYLRDEAGEYEDDGSNEPLELARTIEDLLAQAPAQGGAE